MGFAHRTHENRRLRRCLCGRLVRLVCLRHATARLALFHRCEERRDTDLRGSERIALVDLKKRVKLSGPLQDFGHLIRRDGINAAAEIREMDQLNTGLGRRERGRAVKPRVISPLVDNTQLPGFRRELHHRVFRHDRHAQRRDVVGKPMIDQWIHVVRTACDQDHRLAGSLSL